MKFLDHYKIGEVIASETFCGFLVDADERGVYYDMEDEGITFVAWKSINRIWNGPLAEKMRQYRNEHRIDHNVTNEEMQRALSAAYGELRKGGPLGPALSEEEIRELLAAHEGNA